MKQRTKNANIDALPKEQVVDLELFLGRFVERVVEKLFDMVDAGNFARERWYRLPYQDPMVRYAALQRGFHLYDFTARDISHFLGGVPIPIVASAFQQMGERSDVKPKPLPVNGLERWQASQIYEHYDAEKDRRHIANDLKLPLAKVTEAIMKGREVEPLIAEDLRVLYGNPALNKAYR